MRQKKRMLAAEFEAVRPLLKISADRVEAARLALVDGKTLQSVGERYGWTKQAVADAIGVVWRALETYRESQRAAACAGVLLPDGWEQVVLIAPSNLIQKFRREVTDAIKETLNDQKEL